MNSSEIRTKFLEFFKSKGHTIVPSSSLLPTDPSVLFTTAGMQQFKEYYTHPENAPAKNVTSIQKCLRTSDIDGVGDESHLTFFEMLGNFSFGGYWKKEAIKYAHEFITKEMGLTIDYVSVFGGEDDVSIDEESATIWKSIDPHLEVKKFGRADNFWGPTGNEGPCGPTTEIYVNGVEIWNIVFNEYYQTTDKQLKPLEIKGIDTGMGLERLATVSQNKSNIFETDLFSESMATIPDEVSEREKRIVCDHHRAAMFLIADGVQPSNKDQGYVLRRLMRREITIEEIYYSQKNIQIPYRLVMKSLIKNYTSTYPQLNFESILEVWDTEIKKFYKTLRTGLKELEKASVLDAPNAFKLYESFGLPFEVIKEVAKDKASGLTREAFEEERRRHQEISRAGAEKKFGGHGITVKEGELSAESQEEMMKKTRLHTATHVVVAALEKVLGEPLKQAGSDITGERLRFDFAFPRKLTADEIERAEKIANQAITDNLEVWSEELSLEEAFASGAQGAFAHKYPPRVKVYTIGPKGGYFSREICGGPHVTRTGEIGHITITKEESVSGGNRRIRATVD